MSTTSCSIEVHNASRSDAVLDQINAIKGRIVNDFLLLARLLKESRDCGYAQKWGFARFDEWLENGSGLDLSARSAYYLINIVERAEQLGIPDDCLRAVKISALKEIMSLPDTTPAETIRALVNDAKEMSYKSVRDAIGTLKNESYVYHTIKMSEDAENNVYQPSLERVRREFGSTVGPDGQPEDISDSRAIEMLMADFLSTPEAEDIVDGEFVDVIEG